MALRPTTTGLHVTNHCYWQVRRKIKLGEGRRKGSRQNTVKAEGAEGRSNDLLAPRRDSGTWVIVISC